MIVHAARITGTPARGRGRRSSMPATAMATWRRIDDMMAPIPGKTLQWAIRLVCILALSACATAPSPTVEVEADPVILRVGVSPDAPPLIFKQNGDITGLEAELANELATYLNKKAVLIELPWQDQIPALLANRTDIIMSGMSVTPARLYEVAFAEPYFKSGLMMLARDLHKYAFIQNAETAFAQSITWNVGVIKGTIGERFINEKNTGVKAIRTFANQDQALRALVDGGIDVLVHDAPMILAMAVRHQQEGVKPLPFMFNENYLAWAMRKDDPAMTASVNAFIRQANQDGRLPAIIKRWIPLAH
jgi:polar amino acid transport system substrate-binding protein